VPWKGRVPGKTPALRETRGGEPTGEKRATYHRGRPTVEGMEENPRQERSIVGAAVIKGKTPTTSTLPPSRPESQAASALHDRAEGKEEKRGHPERPFPLRSSGEGGEVGSTTRGGGKKKEFELLKGTGPDPALSTGGKQGGGYAARGPGKKRKKYWTASTLHKGIESAWLLLRKEEGGRASHNPSQAEWEKRLWCGEEKRLPLLAGTHQAAFRPL